MIVKTSKGYFVKSQEGKNLGGPYKSKDQAEKRLNEVEMFKAMERRAKKAYS